MNLLKKTPGFLQKIRLFKPSRKNREFNLTQFGLPKDLKENSKVLNDVLTNTNTSSNIFESVDFNKFVGQCNTYDNYFRSFVQDNNNMTDVHLGWPTKDSIINVNWESFENSSALGVNTQDFVKIMSDGWKNENLRMNLEMLMYQQTMCDVVPEWVNGFCVDNVPKSYKQYAWDTTHRTYHDLFLNGPRMLYEFDTNTDSLKQYMEMRVLDQKAQVVNDSIDDLERNFLLYPKHRDYNSACKTRNHQ